MRGGRVCAAPAPRDRQAPGRYGRGAWRLAWRLRHRGCTAHYGPTATPLGPFWREAMTFAPVPSRLASLIVPTGLVTWLAQYRWLAFTATPYGLPLWEAMTFAPVPSR